MAALATIAMALAVLVFVAYVVKTESRRLDAAAQRFRELEHEGLADSDLIDQLPEISTSPRTIVQADGTETGARRLLHEELDRLRRYGPNRPTGDVADSR